jgi:hypothetical protein
MLFRIDKQRFLTHMIDHFTLDELLSLEYAIISASVIVKGYTTNVQKINVLYPDVELVLRYDETNDKDIFKKMYFDELTELTGTIYRTFVANLLEHKNICIVCDEKENFIIDVLCEFLKKKFNVDTIDLNELFIKGRVGPYYLDLDEVENKSVDIRRKVVKDKLQSMESTRDGRMTVLKGMTKDDKIKKLKSLGINVKRVDHINLDQLLIDGWVEDD